MLYIKVFPRTTAFPSLCCKRGICIAWYSQPWQVLSSHISHGTTSHRCHIQSKTRLRCSSHHSSHRAYHRAHLRPLHNSLRVASDCCFESTHLVTSAKIFKNNFSCYPKVLSQGKSIKWKLRPLHLCAVSGFTSTIHTGFVFNRFPSRCNFK